MLAARQATYWWHRARRAMSAALLRRHGLGSGTRWLDLGCGPGGNLQLLEPMAPALVVGVDLSPIALALARSAAPGAAALIRADITRGLPFGDAAFDLVTVFNVLYHAWVTDERAVLGEAARVLRRGGLILLTEPAFSMLARDMDTIGMARRRYRRRDLAAVCQSVGLDLVFSSYFTSFGFPLLAGLALGRRFGRVRRRDPADLAPDMKPLRPTINEALCRLAGLEARLIGAGLAMPFGTTLVCVARKA